MGGTPRTSLDIMQDQAKDVGPQYADGGTDVSHDLSDIKKLVQKEFLNINDPDNRKNISAALHQMQVNVKNRETYTQFPDPNTAAIGKATMEQTIAQLQVAQYMVDPGAFSGVDQKALQPIINRAKNQYPGSDPQLNASQALKDAAEQYGQIAAQDMFMASLATATTYDTYNTKYAADEKNLENAKKDNRKGILSDQQYQDLQQQAVTDWNNLAKTQREFTSYKFMAGQDVVPEITRNQEAYSYLKNPDSPRDPEWNVNSKAAASNFNASSANIGKDYCVAIQAAINDTQKTIGTATNVDPNAQASPNVYPALAGTKGRQF